MSFEALFSLKNLNFVCYLWKFRYEDKIIGKEPR